MNNSISTIEALWLQKQVRRWLLFFMVTLVLSGLTALGVETQLQHVLALLPNKEATTYHWLQKVYQGLKITNQQYPFLSYGFDWLAFAHLVIAVAFIGPYQQPVKNIWVMQFGRIACLMIIPFAMLAGTFRGLPFWWLCIDCSFGIVGLIPLTICYRLTKRHEKYPIITSSQS